MTNTNTNTNDYEFNDTYLNLINTKSKNQILEIFWGKLTKKYPHPEDIKITIVKTGKLKDKGHTGGIVTSCPKTRTSQITIFNYNNEELPNILSTLAHEYKHILQAFAENTGKWEGGKAFNSKREIDAHIFGILSKNSFCYKNKGSL